MVLRPFFVADKDTGICYSCVSGKWLPRKQPEWTSEIFSFVSSYVQKHGCIQPRGKEVLKAIAFLYSPNATSRVYGIDTTGWELVT